MTMLVAKHFLQFLSGLALSTKLPDECVVKAVLKKLLLSRFAVSGGRKALLGEKIVEIFGSDGKVQWALVGVYGFEWSASGEASHIIHRPSGARVAVPAHVGIVKEYQLDANWHDMSAAAVLHPSRHFLKDFFTKEPAVGPWAVVPWKATVAKDEAHDLLEAWQQEKAGLKADGDTVWEVKAPTKRSAEAASRARQALKRRKEADAAKRMSPMASST